LRQSKASCFSGSLKISWYIVSKTFERTQAGALAANKALPRGAKNLSWPAYISKVCVVHAAA